MRARFPPEFPSGSNGLRATSPLDARRRGVDRRGRVAKEISQYSGNTVAQRYGLIYVDDRDQKRTSRIQDSGTARCLQPIGWMCKNTDENFVLDTPSLLSGASLSSHRWKRWANPPTSRFPS
jgi:hypothetical protein